MWLLHKQDTYNKPPFLTVITTEELFLAQAVVPSVVLAKYRELTAKMAVLSSKRRTDFSHKFGSTRLVSDEKLNFLVLACGFFRQGVLLSPQATTIQFARAVCACIKKLTKIYFWRRWLSSQAHIEQILAINLAAQDSCLTKN